MPESRGLLARVRNWLRRDRPLVADEGGPARSLSSYESEPPSPSAGLTDEERAALTVRYHDEADDEVDSSGPSGDALPGDTDSGDEFDVRVVGTVGPGPSVDDSPDQDALSPDSGRPCKSFGELVVTPPATSSAAQQAREQRLIDGVQHVTDLLDTIRDGIQSQQQRQQELLDKFDHLPEFLAQVPETGKAQLGLLENLHQELARAGRAEAELAANLSHLPALVEAVPEMVHSQSALLNQVADRLVAQGRHNQELGTSLEAMRCCLGQVAATSESQVHCLASMELAHQRNMQSLADSLEGQGRKTTALLATALGIGAVTLAGLFFLVTVIARAGLLGP